MSETVKGLVANFNNQCGHLVARPAGYYTTMLQEVVAAAAKEGKKVLCDICGVEYNHNHTDDCIFKGWIKLWIKLSVSEECSSS